MDTTPAEIADAVMLQLEPRLNGMDRRLDRMDRRLDHMDQRIDTLTHEMRNGVLHRLERLEAQVGALALVVEGIVTTLGEVHAAAVPDAK